MVGINVNSGSDDNEILGNIVSANRLSGISVAGTRHLLEGNLVGTGADGASTLANNGPGIDLFGANLVQIGTPGGGNTIAFNLGDGIRIASGSGNTVLANSIRNNRLRGIALQGTGANHGQQPPVLTGASSIFLRDPGPPPRFVRHTFLTGTMPAAGGSASFTLDVYANPECPDPVDGEGRIFVGSFSVSTFIDRPRDFTVTIPNGGAGPFVTAIARSSDGDTSEFSNCIASTP